MMSIHYVHTNVCVYNLLTICTTGSMYVVHMKRGKPVCNQLINVVMNDDVTS